MMSITLAVFLASPMSETEAIQLRNINSKFKKLQGIANKSEMIKSQNSFAQQKDDNGMYIDESIYHDDTGQKWVTFMDTFGRDPNPGYHDVHYMSRPDFKKDVASRNAYPEESFAQRPQSLVQKDNGRKYYLDGDDTCDRWVKCIGAPHDVHAMARPDYKSSVYHCGPWSDVYVPRPWESLAQQQHVDDVTDDSADKWVHWPRTGKDPNPGYHDVHFMIRPDFNVTTLQWPRSLAQAEGEDDYKYDDWTGDKWVKYPHGREPFPPPHDPEWYRKEDFWHSVYQPIKPAKSFVQESAEEPDDYKYDDWTGDKWVKYPHGREPFPPPHDPEWYRKEDFWHSIYQPVKPAKQ